jgi:hypothetical protein
VGGFIVYSVDPCGDKKVKTYDTNDIGIEPYRFMFVLLLLLLLLLLFLLLLLLLLFPGHRH